MKRSGSILFGLLILSLSAGCGKKGVSGVYHDASRNTEFAFTDDGQFSCSINAPTFHGCKGTYQLDGNTLTLTMTEEDGKKPEGKDAETVKATLSDDGKTITANGEELVKD